MRNGRVAEGKAGWLFKLEAVAKNFVFVLHLGLVLALW
jgi:hypothetical protein